MLTSQLCTRGSLASPALRAWSERLRPVWDADGTDPKPFVMHRKMWEWLFICRALEERGMLVPGRRGLGFGVGREPLVALFAAQGPEIVATDLEPDQAARDGWTATGAEYTGGLAGLNDHGLCPPEEFAARVQYRYVDMREIPDDLTGFDFTWSSCAFEHLGDLAAGLEFVTSQMRCVVPGGVAVHTTEFNVSPGDRTIDHAPTVLYRRRDIEGLVERLVGEGFAISCDFTEGDTPDDRHVDVPPFSDTHLRTRLGEFETTSIALVIEKPTAWRPRRRFARRRRRGAP